THVGMDRRPWRAGLRPGPKPHARGDGPRVEDYYQEHPGQAPRTWGWTDDLPAGRGPGRPSPTHVGMDRSGCLHPVVRKAKPHARGDGPNTSLDGLANQGQAPRTWGWTAAA